MKKIKLHPDLVHQIANEFKTSYQNVRMCLIYVHNSELSVAIRMRAKELLIEEAEKVTEYHD